MPTPNLAISGGAFEDFEGSVLNLGYLVMELSHDENYSVGPYQIGSGLILRIPLDASGNINPSVNVWSNDTLTPAGSYYLVRAFKADGVLAWGPQTWQLTSSPNPLNVGSIIPTNPPGGLIGGGSGSSLVVQTDGVNNTSQALLNFVDSASVTFSNPSGGVVTAVATGGGGGGVSGSGVAGQIAVWTGTTSVGTTDASLTNTGSTNGQLLQAGNNGTSGGPFTVSGGNGTSGSGGRAQLSGGSSSSSNGGDAVLRPGHGTPNGVMYVFGGTFGAVSYFDQTTFSALATPPQNPGWATTVGALIFCSDAKGPQDSVTWGSIAAGSGTGGLLRYDGTNWRLIG